MSDFSRDELLDLAAAYALGATSPSETAAIEASLPTMPDLAAEISAYTDVTVTLAQQQAMAPSPDVRAAFLDGVGASKRRSLTRTPAIAARSRWPLALVSVGLAASLVVAVRYASQVSRLEGDVAARERALAGASAEAEKRHHQLNLILEGEKDLVVVHLKAADTTAGPGVQLFWNQKQRLAIGHAFRLKPAPTGRAYQVWFVVSGKPFGVKVFNSDPDGHALFEDFALPAVPDGVTEVLVTEEPSTGSPQPTSAPFMGGRVSAN